MNKSLITLAVNARAYLESHKDTLGLPFISRFPPDSCEIASLVLAYIFKDEYPDIDFFIVKAEKPSCGLHFWVEAEGNIFDLTADQLENINFPIFGEPSAPQLHDSKIYEKSEICAELKDHDWLDLPHALHETSQVVRSIA